MQGLFGLNLFNSEQVINSDEHYSTEILFLPSISSIVRSGRSDSHHFTLVPGTLPFQSVISNLLSRVPRYISEMAIISGSHCKHSVVQRLQRKRNICMILWTSTQYLLNKVVLDLITGT